MNLKPRLNQGYCLNYTQRLGLKQLFLLQQRLKRPEHPNAVKGLEGMHVAHQILQNRKSTGVLIGGLSEAVWNQRRKEDELYAHKDVDVMVLDEYFDAEKFEGGIDWWIPQRGKITLKSDYGRIEDVERQWYENGNGVVLSFGAEKYGSLLPGLYIPDSEWVTDMREYEVRANLNYGIELGAPVFEKFRNHIRKRVKTRLPKFICEAFKGYILSPYYEPDCNKVFAIRLVEFYAETLKEIRGLEEILE